MELRNRKLETGIFRGTQAEVLGQWDTGRDVDLPAAAAYHGTLQNCKRFPDLLQGAKERGKTLIQSKTGSALVDQHIRLLVELQNRGEADLLSTSIDDYTRQNRYKEAALKLGDAAVNTIETVLNGFPVVNHGVVGCRRVTESLDRPVQVCRCTSDARLLAEISFAGGFTSLEGGGISCNIPYAKSISLEKTIADWQYVDRLTGLYAEMGIVLNREPFGPLTGTLVPPCISHAVAIIESLLAAEQGVKDITVGYSQSGNLVQDVAALQVLQALTETYLRQYGFDDVQVSTALYQWMGGFPQDEAKAFSVIALGSVAAALAHTTKVVVKAPQEGLGMPTTDSYIQGLRCTKQMISMLGDQWLDEKSLAAEKMMIEAETHCLVDKCIELGEGDVAVGVIHGFEAGVIDIPFAPSRFNAGKMLPARDNDGAIRILEAGALPLSRDLVDANREKIQARAAAEKRVASYQMVIDDVYAISKGRLVGRPR